ncbi:GDP-L-fucose synthase [Prolixibacter sp. NT017]|uniref:GDP-L-fucose synthase family protein n=1 Tax=Prolixibacter sp. NT017 TaxID=2652390 RepID=UPI00128380AF|nr:GDP-L-fucose synthase [Prolixibacter sp. NT017]GET24180.1 GDP-L-fucose synthase [Prolixibacter sp. NT017]
MEQNSKIYIAGHRGLVGSAILKNLKEKGYTNFVLRTHSKLDLTNQQAVADFFAEEKPEYVFLAAAKVGGIVANNTYRGQFIYENLMIQNNVIHAAYKNNVKKLMFLGSTCIYPREAPQPMPEDSLLTSPLEYTNEPYAIAKIAGIKLCESYNLQYGTNYISVMPTNLYGPNDNFDLEKSHVLPALLRKAHLGKCLEEGNWETLRADLDKNPVEGVNGKASEEQILETLEKYGIRSQKSKVKSQKSNDDLGPSTLDLRPVSIEIWGSGKPMREFLWSEDMADACVFLMENVEFTDIIESQRSKVEQSEIPTLGVGVKGQKSDEDLRPSDIRRSTEIRNTHINIGTGKEVSIKQLAELIKEKVGFKGDLVFNTDKPDGTLRKLTDPSKLHQLGWQHKIEIEDGIEQMYNWYLG